MLSRILNRLGLARRSWLVSWHGTTAYILDRVMEDVRGLDRAGITVPETALETIYWANAALHDEELQGNWPLVRVERVRTMVSTALGLVRAQELILEAEGNNKEGGSSSE